MAQGLAMTGIDEIGKKIPVYLARKPKEPTGKTKE
jgi:hypothetical protein